MDSSSELSKSQKWKAMRCLYVAPSGYGKTYLLCKRVLQYIKEGRYKPENIIIFANNHLTDSSLQPVIRRCKKRLPNYQETHCYKDINVELINQLYESQNIIMEEQQRWPPSYLLILDDQLTNPDLFSAKSPVRDVMIQGRHRCISIIICQQKLKMSSVGSTLIRENCTEINVGHMASQSAVEGFLDEYSGQLGSTKRDAVMQLVKWYDDAVSQSDGKGFLVIRPELSVKDGRFSRSSDDKQYRLGSDTVMETKKKRQAITTQ